MKHAALAIVSVVLGLTFIGWLLLPRAVRR